MDGSVWLAAFTFTMLILALTALLEYIWRINRELLKLKYNAARAWKEGYDQGVNDERTAEVLDIPEYRTPKRQNPYGRIPASKKE